MIVIFDRSAILAWFVSKTSPFCLAAAKYVSDKSLPTVQAFNSGRLCVGNGTRPVQCRFDERPAATYPVAVATVYELIRSASEATFRRVLPGGKP